MSSVIYNIAASRNLCLGISKYVWILLPHSSGYFDKLLLYLNFYSECENFVCLFLTERIFWSKWKVNCRVVFSLIATQVQKMTEFLHFPEAILFCISFRKYSSQPACSKKIWNFGENQSLDNPNQSQFSFMSRRRSNKCVFLGHYWSLYWSLEMHCTVIFIYFNAPPMWLHSCIMFLIAYSENYYWRGIDVPCLLRDHVTPTEKLATFSAGYRHSSA